jgi:hypothetical protein
MMNGSLFFDHGDITADEANRRLVSRPPGTFLFRKDPDSSIVVALKMDTGRPAVSQISIGRAGKFTFQGTQYSTIDELLRGTGKTLRIPLPFFDHGDIDFGETARRLTSTPVGAFLFRNSQDAGFFVIASKTGSAVEQKKIARSPTTNDFQYNQYSYDPTSIGDLVYRNRTVLITPLPAPRPQPAPFVQVAIYDGLSPSQTNALLSRSPVGTYLFRTSKSLAIPGALILVYNAGAAGVLQMVLEPALGGGYTVQDATISKYYLNIDDVLFSHKSMLLHPYSGPISGAPMRVVQGNRGGRRRTRNTSSSWMRLVKSVHSSRTAQDSNALYRDSLVQASKLYRTQNHGTPW